MTTAQLLTLQNIISQAEHERRHDYRAYERIKSKLAALGLRPDEFEQAVRRVAKALGV